MANSPTEEVMIGWSMAFRGQGAGKKGSLSRTKENDEQKGDKSGASMGSGLWQGGRKRLPGVTGFSLDFLQRNLRKSRKGEG